MHFTITFISVCDVHSEYINEKKSVENSVGHVVANS